MNRLIMIWGVLLLAGIFTVSTVQSTTSKAPELSSSTINMSSTSHMSSSTTHSTPHVTSNTTHSTPQTTSNTTHTPSNTTSHAPTNTTTHPTTAHTTSPILPTKPSPPIRREYTVKNATNKTCIIADMGLALELDNSTTVMQDKDAKVKWYFNVNPNATTANGTCNESTATLILTFPQGSIHFVFVKDKKIYYIDEVSVNFTWNSAEHWNGTARNLKLLSTDVGYATKCKTTPSVKLASNLSLSMADVKLQVFDLPESGFGKEKVCSADRNKLLVPVGVALAVVGLILIILLVVLLSRRRRSPGYERI